MRIRSPIVATGIEVEDRTLKGMIHTRMRLVRSSTTYETLYYAIRPTTMDRETITILESKALATTTEDLTFRLECNLYP